MSDTKNWTTIALIQLETHPAFTINGLDYLSEPFLPSGHSRPHLNRLELYRLPITEDKEHFRRSYLEWHKRRLEGVLSALRDADPKPKLLAFSEGAIPLQSLDVLVDFAKETKSIIFAGTHAFSTDRANRERYIKQFHVPELEYERIAREANKLMNPSVMPVLRGDRIQSDGSVTISLHLKLTHSPSEQDETGFDHNSAPPEPQEIPDVELQEKQRIILPLVCSDALQLLNAKANPGVVVISAYDPNPDQFLPEILRRTKNQQLVLFVNDGRFGGTGAHFVTDSRPQGGWMGEPTNGLLPKGDGFVLIEVNLSSLFGAVGVNNPRLNYILHSVQAVVPSSPSISSYRVAKSLNDYPAPGSGDCSASAARPGVDSDAQLRFIEGLLHSESPTPIQSAKLHRMAVLARNLDLSARRWDIYGTDCIYPSTSDLSLLERSFASRLLTTTSHILHSRTTTQPSVTAIVDCVRACEERVGNYPTARLTDTLWREIRRVSRESVRHAHKALQSAFASIAEQFNANSGWVFCLQETPTGEAYVGKASHNAPPRELILEATGDSVVWRVAKSNEGYVGSPPPSHSVREVVGSQSILAVPVRFPSSDPSRYPDVIVALESRERSAFNALHISELRAVSESLLVDLHVILSSQEMTRDDAIRMAWHPSVHGWRLRGLLERFSYCLATAVSPDQQKPAAACVIWSIDRENSCLHALACAGVGYDYLAERSLPLKSYIGTAAEAAFAREEANVNDTLIADEEFFLDKEKARKLELEKVIRVPIFMPDDSSPSRAAAGVISLFLYRHHYGLRDADITWLYNKADLWNVGLLLGRIIHHVLQETDAIAHMQLSQRLWNSYTPRDRVYHEFLRVATQVFTADGGTVFVHNAGSVPRTGGPVATTGLSKTDAQAATIPFEPLSPWTSAPRTTAAVLDRDVEKRGFTAALAAQPGSCIRLSDATEEHIRRKVSAGRPREALPFGEDSHPRLLAYALPGTDGPTIAVIRLLRKSSSPPFCAYDETKLKQFTRLLLPVLDRRERQAATRAKAANSNATLCPTLFQQTPPEYPENLRNRRSDAMRQLAVDVPTNAFWHKHRVQGILDDVALVLHPCDPVSVALCFQRPWSDFDPQRPVDIFSKSVMYDWYSSRVIAPLSFSLHETLGNHPTLIESCRQEKVISFQTRVGSNDCYRHNAHFAMPVHVFRHHRCLRGVLVASLEANNMDRYAQDILNCLWLAARKLSFNGGREAGNPFGSGESVPLARASTQATFTESLPHPDRWTIRYGRALPKPRASTRLPALFRRIEADLPAQAIDELHRICVHLDDYGCVLEGASEEQHALLVPCKVGHVAVGVARMRLDDGLKPSSLPQLTQSACVAIRVLQDHHNSNYRNPLDCSSLSWDKKATAISVADLERNGGGEGFENGIEEGTIVEYSTPMLVPRPEHVAQASRGRSAPRRAGRKSTGSGSRRHARD